MRQLGAMTVSGNDSERRWKLERMTELKKSNFFSEKSFFSEIEPDLKQIRTSTKWKRKRTYWKRKRVDFKTVEAEAD